jgi:hypothetical protein
MAKDTAVRQREWREKRKAEGYQMLTVWLEPETAQMLEDMAERNQDESKLAAKTRLVNEAIRRIWDWGKA